MNPQHVYQVAELVKEMQQLLETSYRSIWIEGELSSLSCPASGHIYFTLKDEQSQIRCAMFRSNVMKNRYQAKAGDLIRIRGRISVYGARGDLQCIVQQIEEAGLGLLHRRFEELKLKLQQQGLFDHASKQALPERINTIGLITSASGAAVKDVISTLARRAPGLRVIIYPAIVQGDEAPASLIAALQAAQQHQRCDVLIIGRGGGSLEDLWAFNSEQLALALADCPIATVSAVGHEIDVSITDLVADVRAPTPTAAAELVSPDQTAQLKQLQNLGRRLQHGIHRQLQEKSQASDLTAKRLRHPAQHLKAQHKDLANARRRLLAIQSNRLQLTRQQFAALQLRLGKTCPDIEIRRKLLNQQSTNLQLGLQRALGGTHRLLTHLGEQLQLVSPLATLQRGYSITLDSHGKLARQSKTIKPGDSLQTRLAEGTIYSSVDRVEE